jgi:hypothetical protein
LSIKLLLMAAALIAALVVVEVLVDPLSWLKSVNTAYSVRETLSIARERWQSQGITSYTVDVEGFVPLVCMINATLTVHEDKLVAVESRGLPGYDTGEGISVAPEDWDAPYCSYNELVVPELFVRIESALDRIDWSRDTTRVRFDPEYGYVTEYRYICCYRRGLLNPTCSDCNVWFVFSNFHPNTDS